MLRPNVCSRKLAVDGLARTNQGFAWNQVLYLDEIIDAYLRAEQVFLHFKDAVFDAQMIPGA